MIELNQLEQFTTIVEQGTISKAAETLLISQPALTRSIQRLEEELRIELFDRKKNKISLNDNGKLAYDYAKKLLASANQMVNDLRIHDKSHQTISIGSLAPAPLWGVKYLLLNTYPYIQIDDEIRHYDTSLLEGLKKDQFTLIILNYPYEDEEYQSIELFEENLYLSLPPAHPLALFKDISFEDLNGESILLLSNIGFWNELCLKHIPDSHLLIQNDIGVFNEIKKASALPNFKTNITLLRSPDDNRINIPIINQEAHIKFYAVFKKDKKELFQFIQNDITNINWLKT